MNKARVLPCIAFWSVAALTLAAACLRTVAFCTGYDGDIGYFRSGTVTVVYRILAFCAVLIPTVCGMLIPEGILPAPHRDAGRDSLAVLPLIACAMTTPFFLLNSSVKGTVSVLCTVLALCSAAHFLLAVLGAGSRSTRGVLGFAVILLCMLIIGLTYNDPYVTMNSPVKLTVQFACAGAMLGMTADLRMLLEKPAPRLALSVLSAAAFFGVAGAAPCVIARIAGFIPAGRPEGGQLYFVFLCFSVLMGVYMLLRLAQCVFVSAGAEDAGSSDTATPEVPGGAEPTDADSRDGGSDSDSNRNSDSAAGDLPPQA